MLRRLVLFATALSAAAAVRAAAPALLTDAVEQWLGERDHWAFTQRAVEYDKGATHERLERFDPSRPGDARWELLAVDGHAPSDAERQKWADKKFRHHPHRLDTPVSDFFDFDSAHVVAETARLVRYEVPLRRDKAWMFPVDKVGVRVTIDKQTHALQHLTAHVREPFRILLGVARVTGGDLDVDFVAAGPKPPAANSKKEQPRGEARVSVSKLGERVDFTWSDFTRVQPARDTAAVDTVPELLALAARPQ